MSDDDAGGPAAAADSAAAHDLPFLVTHWLSHFVSEEGAQRETGAAGREEALRRVRGVASDLASAFSALGAFGTMSSLANNRPATYPDLARRHAYLPPTQLQSVLASGASATAAVQALAERRSGRSGGSSALAAADEDGHPEDPTTATRAEVGPDDDGTDPGAAALSVLRPPAMLSAPLPAASGAEPRPPPSGGGGVIALAGGVVSAADLAGMSDSVDGAFDDLRGGAGRGEALPGRRATVAIKSDWAGANVAAGAAAREHVSLRTRHRVEGREMTTIRAVIADRTALRDDVARQRTLADAIVSGTGVAAAAAAAEVAKIGALKGDEGEDLDLRALEAKDMDAERVIAQLERRLEQLVIVHSKTAGEMSDASNKARALRSESLILRQKYGDAFSRGCSSGSSVAAPGTGAVLPVPFAACGGPRSSSLLSTVIARPYCSGGMFRTGLRTSGRLPNPASLTHGRKQLLSQRLSHAVTFSCHLFYPVYCLRFDRTGRYFVSGADDHLAKLFHLGAGVEPSAPRPPVTGRPHLSYGSNARGAVLVCSLRGHGGVITDIDISSDNAMLATASEDGDVRVWGLRDGAPIAILRGHAGGANMVSWSPLTPYRLVTTGQDGLAREWDVREAALKRYGGVIGKRADYLQPCLFGDFASEEEDGSDDEVEADGEDDVALPPLPMRQAAGPRANEDNAAVSNGNEIFVPPLPPGAEGVSVGGGNGMLPGAGAGAGAVGAGASGDNDNGDGNLLRDDAARAANNVDVLPQPGAFVPGHAVDEGVTLLSKLQHGEILQGNQMNGPSTRSQRKAVKVICLSRCPLGGHFVTGSDDGLGRIWADEEDDKVERQDCHLGDGPVHRELTTGDAESSGARKRTSGRLKRQRNRGRGDVAPSKMSLLALLPGHLNSITDVQYSNAGDRILTASQKDGVVRIWSWGNESARVEHNPLDPSSPASKTRSRVKFDNIKQVLIRLTAPPELSATAASSQSTSSRRRGGPSSGPSSADVSCDVAVWSGDDSKVITSQTCLIKQGGADIVPGSHVLYVWDSRCGRCLTGIPSAHNAPCPVLTCHPLEPTIVASAGGDGRVNVWDLDTGKRLFEHENRLLHGPIDPPTNRGKTAGFLDGCFSPDGLFLVLTDDAGRVTVVDTLLSAEEAKKAKAASAAAATSQLVAGTHGSQLNPISLGTNERADVPHWMKEQYFGNDYYDLFYDNNGYCIERGSEQPPHLAPRAARCNHSGEACSDLICEALAKMAGPQPLSEEEVRWRRDGIRTRGGEVRQSEGLLLHNVQGRRTATNSYSSGTECHAYESAFAGLLRKVGARAPAERAVNIRQTLSSLNAPPGLDDSRTSSQPARALSSRYRWIGYEDMHNDTVEMEEEEDDEEYQDAPRGRRLHDDEEASNASDAVEYESDDMDLSDVDSHSPRASRSSSRRSSGGRRLGGSGRRRSSGSEAASPAARSQRQQRRGRDRERHVAFEEQQLHQPTRVSRRQMSSPSRQRRRYEVPGSDDDDDLIEEMSTNKAPSGKYVEDYTVRGHLFKLPERGLVYREWLCRTESETGMLGKRIYAPQVGDSVVYIPRAHKDTIQEFPTVDNSVAPWKSWPTSSAWPVVQCTVRHIRYRFPYENYYRNRSGASCLSIVVILTLEVTGIPQIASDRKFPWPKPEFISRLSRSAHKTFELSVFDNDQPDFLMPEHLYMWKIKELERAIRSRDHDAEGLELVSYFAPSEGEEGHDTEDPELIPFKCTVSSLSPPNEEELHFENSGYNAFDVTWAGSDDVNAVSAWELTLLENADSIPPPLQLNDDEKTQLLNILDQLEEDRKIRIYFFHPVNTSRYSDYLNMIEVPMDLQVIRKRLRQDYYTNRLSFLADVELIKENCIKYNGDDGALSLKACEMYDTAKELIDELPDYPRRQHQDTECGDSTSRTTTSPAFNDETMQSPRRTSSRLAHRNTSSAQSTPTEAPSSQKSARQSRRTNRDGRSSAASSLENLPDSQGPNHLEGQPSNARRRIRLSLRPAAAASTPDMVRATRSTRSPGMQNVSDDDSAGVDEEQAGSEAEGAYNTPDEDEDEDDAEEEEDEPVERSRRARVTSSKITRSSSCTTRSQDTSGSEESEDDQDDQDDHGRQTRRSSRTRRSPRKLCEDDSSENEGMVQRVVGRTRKRDARSPDESEESPSRRSRQTVNYEEHGSSDFDPASDDESDDELANEMSDSSEEVETSNRGRRSTKRRRGPTNRKGGAKKSKAAPRKAAAKCLYYPDLAQWPPVVDTKNLIPVSERIMELVCNTDTDHVFSAPVAEEYPDMADDYLAKVGTPMDFRTIIEERIPRYNGMAELQDDLILTYKNCCVYNGEGDKLYFYAIDCWKDLNTIFKQVCEEEGIMLPRRWS